MSHSNSNKIQPTAQETALKQNAIDKINDYKQRWAPVENYFMSRVAQIPGTREAAVGRTEGETRAQFGKAEGALESSLANRGAGAGSGKSVLGVGGLNLDMARSTGLNAAGTSSAVDQEYANGLQQIVAMGRGQQANNAVNLSQSADTAAQVARNDATLSAQNREGTGQLIGTVAGYGLTRMGAPKSIIPPGQGVAS